MRDENDTTDVQAALSVQQAYYRAVAPHYDEEYPRSCGPLRYAARALDVVGVRGEVLELACRTGQWSRLLQHLTAAARVMNTYPNKILRTERGSFPDYDLAERYRGWLNAA
jgi:hypothetical protein